MQRVKSHRSWLQVTAKIWQGNMFSLRNWEQHVLARIVSNMAAWSVAMQASSCASLQSFLQCHFGIISYD